MNAHSSENGREKHHRYFRIAGVTVHLESKIDFADVVFKKELAAFAVAGLGDDNITFRHNFQLPNLKGKYLGEQLYYRAPWAISRKKGFWFYRGILPNKSDAELHRFAIFSTDHRRGTIYSPPDELARVKNSGWESLSLFPTDQIWLAPLLAERQAVLLHSAAAVINGQGFVFVGHSDAGKSTTMELLKAARLKTGLEAEILCDDRNVVRRWQDGWRVHGTWSHGTTDDVSPGEAPLRAILFLRKAEENRLAPLNDRKLVWRSLLATLIRAAVTAEWWQKEIDVLELLIRETPCYMMYFDKTGAIVSELERLTA